MSVFNPWFFRLFAVFVFLLPFVWIPDISDYSNLAKSAFAQTGTLFLWAVFLLSGRAHGPAPRLYLPIDIPLSLFLLWAGLSALWAENAYESLTAWMHWLACAAIYVLTARSMQRWEDARGLLSWLFAAAIGISLLGIAQHLGEITWVPQAVPPAATFANKNMAVHFVVMALPVGFGLFLAAGRRRIAVVTALSCSLALAYLTFTLTRAGWVAAGVQLTVLGILLFSGRKYHTPDRAALRAKTLAAMLGLIVWLLLINLTPSGFKWKMGDFFERAATAVQSLPAPPRTDTPVTFDLDGEGPITTAPTPEPHRHPANTVAQKRAAPTVWHQHRFKMWLNTLAMFQDHLWLGVGLGNQKIHYPSYSRKAVIDHYFTLRAQPEFTHNDYLQMAAELGMAGIGLILALGVAATKLLWRVLTLETCRRRRGLWLGVGLGLIGSLVNALFSFPFQLAVPPFVFMLYLGILAARHAQLSSERAGDPQARKTRVRTAWIRPSATIATCVLLVGVCWLQYRQIMASKHYLRTNQAAVEHAWQRVVDEGMRAYDYNPLEKTVLLYVGFALSSSGRYGEAASALSEALLHHPNRINGLSNLAVAYARMGESRQAIATYRRVIAIKPDCVPCISNLALVQIQSGDLPSALANIRVAAQLKPADADLHFTHGYLAYKTGRFEEAAAAYRKTTEYRPQSAPAHKGLGIVLFKHLGREAEGIEHLKRSLTLNPRTPVPPKLKRLIERYESRPAAPSG